jgi:glycosyltransferase involved in cell wall biosynthesis
VRVLHCITGLNVGGAEIMLHRLLRELGDRARDHAVLSLLPPGPVGAMIAGLGVPVADAGLGRGVPAPWRLARLRARARAFAPEVIHGWMYHGNLAASFVRAAGAAAPVLWSVHHSLQDPRNESRRTRAILRLSAALSPRIAAISYCSAVAAGQHEAIGFAPARRRILPNGVDTDEFRPDPGARARLAALCGAPPGRLLVGHVARDHPMKDAPALVRAIARLAADGREAHAVFVGAGHGDGSALREARRLGIEGRVSCFEARSDIAALTPGLDVFVLCSAWGEAFSLAAGEALSSGVPVAATDVGDTRLLVGEAGVVTPPRDPEALAAALARLDDLGPEGRRAMGLAGRRRVLGEFSLRGYARRTADLYDEALAATR